MTSAAAYSTSVGASSNATHEDDALRSIAERHAAVYRSVGSMVTAILREAVLDGTLSPGEKLRQETLAERLGVSRLPIRSALTQLESDGLVEFEERRGAIVRTMSVGEAQEIYRLRTLLETDALQRAMKTSNSNQIKRLRSLARRVDARYEGAGFIEARENFYAELYDAAENPISWELIKQLRLRMGRYMLGWRILDHGHANSHESLVDAFAAGDPDAAVKTLQKHLQYVLTGVIDMLSSRDSPESSPSVS